MKMKIGIEFESDDLEAHHIIMVAEKFRRTLLPIKSNVKQFTFKEEDREEVVIPCEKMDEPFVKIF